MLFRSKLPNWLFTHIGGFPVSRGRGDIDAMRKCINIIKKGECLSIFPEGTRSKNHIMQPFKTGAAFIASKANTKILPVYIDTNNEGYKLFKKFELRIGKAVTLEEMGYLGKVSGKTLVKITEDIEKQVKMLIK